MAHSGDGVDDVDERAVTHRFPAQTPTHPDLVAITGSDRPRRDSMEDLVDADEDAEPSLSSMVESALDPALPADHYTRRTPSGAPGGREQLRAEMRAAGSEAAREIARLGEEIERLQSERSVAAEEGSRGPRVEQWAELANYASSNAASRTFVFGALSLTIAAGILAFGVVAFMVDRLHDRIEFVEDRLVEVQRELRDIQRAQGESHRTLVGALGKLEGRRELSNELLQARRGSSISDGSDQPIQPLEPKARVENPAPLAPVVAAGQ